MQHRAGHETTARLRGVLTRLAMDRAALGASMAQTARGRDDLLQRVAREVDEVVLPRRIELVSGAGPAGVLVACNRRLTAWHGAAPLADDPSVDEADPDAAARAHADRIRALADRSGAVTLRLAGRALAPGTGGASCSARSLLRAGQSVGQERRIGVFRDRIGDKAIAMIGRMTPGGAPLADGPDETRARLAMLDEALTRTRGPTERVERAGPSCAALALAPDLQAIVARDGQSRLLAAIPQDRLQEVLDAWHAIFGTSDT